MDQENQFAGHGNNKDDAKLETVTLPIIKEEVVVDKQIVENGKVVISKKIIEENFKSLIPVFIEEVIIERIQMDIFIDGMQPVTRVEGEKTIIPILKEVYVKRLLLVEELHISKKKTVNNFAINETLKHHDVIIERHNNSISY